MRLLTIIAVDIGNGLWLQVKIVLPSQPQLALPSYLSYSMKRNNVTHYHIWK